MLLRIFIFNMKWHYFNINFWFIHCAGTVDAMPWKSDLKRYSAVCIVVLCFWFMIFLFFAVKHLHFNLPHFSAWLWAWQWTTWEYILAFQSSSWSEKGEQEKVVFIYFFLKVYLSYGLSSDFYAFQFITSLTKIEEIWIWVNFRNNSNW